LESQSLIRTPMEDGYVVLDNVVLKTGDTFGTTVNSANIISILLVLFLIF